MAINDTTLANLALMVVGEVTVTDVNTDTGKAANLVKTVLEPCRDEIFDLPVNWNFCSTRKELSEHESTPDFGWDHQYILPVNCRRIIATVDENGDDIQYPWIREVYISGSNETEVLLSNQDECRIRYIVLMKKPNTWPAWFAKMVYLNIAMKICKPLTQEYQKYNQVVQWYLKAVEDAEAANGMECAATDDNNVNLDHGHTIFDRAVVDRVTEIQS